MKATMGGLGPLARSIPALSTLGIRTLILTILAIGFLYVTVAISVRWSSSEAELNVLGPPMVSQAAAAARLLDGLSSEDRPLALTAMNSPLLRMTLSKDFDDTPQVESPVPVFVPVIAMFQSVLGDRPFRVYRRTEDGGILNRATLADDLIIVMRLADGSGLVVESGETFRRLVGAYGITLAAGLLGLVLIGLMTWASLSYARPLERLARASKSYVEGADTTSRLESLPETGPKPVRELAAALNLATSKLVRLTVERTTTLAAIAHDLRTYLTRLRMRSEFIEDPLQRDKLTRDIEDMAQLIEDALLLGKGALRQPGFSRVNIMEWLNDYVARRVELGNSVGLVPSDAGILVDIATPELTRVLDNLVDNALRYGGSATIAAMSDGPDGVVIDVIDHGPGVPASFLEHIGEPFTRLDTSRSRDTGGAGLGLSIAKALLDQVGGALSFENVAEGGFRARARLLLRQDP